MPGYSYLLYFDIAANELTPLLAAPASLEGWPANNIAGLGGLKPLPYAD